MEAFLLFLKKYVIPKFIFARLQSPYHFVLAFLGAFFYGFPSKKLVVIGVTGTKGKTTTCNLIQQILNEGGRRTGMATTVNFRIGEKEWVNETKQTMLGRFQLQKLLCRMVKAGCRYAVIETPSEGILQYRHRFIDYSIAVFTNLTPEHIERHGSFENYRSAKIKLFEKVAAKENGAGIYNLDDPNVSHFLKPGIKNKYGYSAKVPSSKFPTRLASRLEAGGQIPNGSMVSPSRANSRDKFQITSIHLFPNKSEFDFSGEKFEVPLIGEFNIYNAATAICLALSQNIPMEQIKRTLKSAKPAPGRMEIIDKGQNFTVIVDYAHEPASLKAAYETITNSKLKVKKSKLICLLGGQGGGRDKWKRAAMGKIAAEHCDKIILTNEDSYDENPSQILSDIKSGIQNSRQRRGSPRAAKFKIQNLFKIIDRKEAIQKAISLAEKGDVVVLTGKGGEVWMCVENGKKIPWSEKRIVEEAIAEADFR